MKLFYSEFRGHQIYNPTIDLLALGLDLEINRQAPFLLAEDWNLYRQAISYCSKKLENNIYLVAYKESATSFSKIDMYKKVRQQIESCMPNTQVAYDDVFVHNKTNSFFLYSGCQVNEEDICNAFSVSNSIIWLGTEESLLEIMNNLLSYDNPTSIKNDLLNRDCILLELLDLGIDGNTLFFLSNTKAASKIESSLQELIT